MANPNLTEPMLSEEISPEPFGPLAGNHADDDGEAMDEILQAPAHEPLSYDDLLKDEPNAIAPTNRIVSRYMAMASEQQPVQFLPADAGRKTLYIYFTANALNSPNAYLTFGSDKSQTYDGAGIRLYPVWISTGIAKARSDVLVMEGYTGPVWIKPDESTSNPATFEVNVWSVTQ